VIIDHGAHSTSRYQRISPRAGQYSTSLFATPSGVYWSTQASDLGTSAEDWRYNPETETVEAFPLDASSIVRTDETSLFYVDSLHRLVVRDQASGEAVFSTAFDEFLPLPIPIGLDGEELFYIQYFTSDSIGSLISSRIDGTTMRRSLVLNQHLTNGALTRDYVYVTFDCGFGCQNLYRVPRSGGPMQTVFAGEENSIVFDVRADACNVYWQQNTIDGVALYASEITP
jgi:hypothetical protein